MNHRLNDVLLAAVLISIPLLGLAQACGKGDPTQPANPAGSGQPPGDQDPPPNNLPPVAVLSVVGPEEGPTPFNVRLDASESYDPDDDPIEFLWLFSDGESATESVARHEFASSGKHTARLIVTDQWGLTGNAGPVDLWGWGLANSSWPKFAHDIRNTGVSENPGPMMDFEHASEGGAFPRYWRGGYQNGFVRAVCIGYEGVVVYTQGSWLRCRTPDGGVLWNIQAESEITAWPAIMHDGSIVAATEGGWVHRVSPDGEVMWSLNVWGEEDYPGPQAVFDSAVNVDGNGIIYVGGYNLGPCSTDEIRGRLIAVSSDGALLWAKVIPYTGPKPIPAINPSGEIVINANEGLGFTSTGDLVTTYSAPGPQGYSVVPAAFGPPAIDPNGFVAFASSSLPLFMPDGSFSRNLLDYDYGYIGPSYYYRGDVGRRQAPVWNANSVNLVAFSARNYPRGTWLSTRSRYGDLSHLITHEGGLPETYRGAGASADSLGRMYIASYGVHAASQLHSYSVAPYLRRYSLWSYFRPAPRMSAPAIGEDGWLYVGCGEDIMAIGD